MTSRKDLRLFRASGFAIWVVVGAPVILRQLTAVRVPPSAAFLAWAASYALFGIAFLLATSGRRGIGRAGALALAAGQSAAVFSLMALPPCFGLEGALLTLVAFQLGALVSLRTAIAWILAQSAGLLAIMWLHWGWHWGIILVVAYLPFQLIVYETTRLLAEETRARQRLAAANAELGATRELLAQSTRIAERSRIARDLHDLLGHHLTALSLNLEIASHLTEKEARARVETAQSITKLLLGDVRGVVGALRQEEALSLPAALHKLADGVPRPRIHVGVSPALAIQDSAAVEVLLRCAQELVTNTIRHAQAENLWLEVKRSGKSVEIRASDDGRGATAIRSGNGLSGMRERLEQRGGTLLVETSPGRGFSVTATLPVPETPS